MRSALEEPKPLPELYKAAGLEFNFSAGHIMRTHGVFTDHELENLLKSK